MHRERIAVLVTLALLFVAVGVVYGIRTWRDVTTTYRIGLPIPAFLLPDELKDPDQIVPNGPPRLPPLRADDPLLYGSASGTVEVVVFGDFECAFCRDQALAMQDALALLGRAREPFLRVIWRDLPLTNQHPNAMAAATVAQCAARQGKFKQMHDALFFEAQTLAESELISLATSLRLNTDSFLTCLRDPAIRFRLNRDLEEARAHAITAVPILFINGVPRNGYTDARTLAAILERELDLATY